MIHESRTTVWVSFGRAAHLSSAIVCAVPVCRPRSKASSDVRELSFYPSSSASPPNQPLQLQYFQGGSGALLLRLCLSFLRLLHAVVGLFPDRPDTGAGLVSPPISGDAYAAVPPMRTPRVWLAAGRSNGRVAAEMRIRLLRKMS
jgi:hypothetical protein